MKFVKKNLGQNFYPPKARLFPLILQQRKCIRISNLGPFLLDLNSRCNIFTLLQVYHTKFSYFHANCARVSVAFWEYLQLTEILHDGPDGRDKFQLCSIETKKGQFSHQALVENWATDLLFQTTVPIGPTLVRVTWGTNMDKVNMSQMPW